jgi:hypothetical protein
MRAGNKEHHRHDSDDMDPLPTIVKHKPARRNVLPDGRTETAARATSTATSLNGSASVRVPEAAASKTYQTAHQQLQTQLLEQRHNIKRGGVCSL